MTEDELQALLERGTPAGELDGLLVEEIGDQDVRLRLPGGAGALSQARLLAFAETALRAAALPAVVALSNLNVTFLRTAGEGDGIAIARVLRKEGDTVHAEAWLFTHAALDAVAHATATLRVPHEDEA